MITAIQHKKKTSIISNLLKKNYQSVSRQKIRFTHGSTNSTRVQDKSDSFLIDISSLHGVLNIDKKNMTATVEPNVPMDQLVEECLRHNLVPKVVMEFPGITCGGGINGAALEASSFKYGQFNDTCLEYECILADGTILTINKKKNADLFYGISGSYGSLALITSITISLLPARPYVFLDFIPVQTNEVISELNRITRQNTDDYLDSIIFSNKKTIIIRGKFIEADSVESVTFSKPYDEWFYLYAKHALDRKRSRQIKVPIKDFLFRYDRGAFWMGKDAFKLFHMPFNRFFRTLLDPLMHTRIMYKALHKSNTAQEFFIQDFYIPLSKTNDFIKFTRENLKILPIWLCPIKSTHTPQYLSPHYLKEEMLIDVGIWGSIPKKMNGNKINKMFEQFVKKIGGRKMLYAESFYTEEQFWKIYDKKAYEKLQQKYKAHEIFPTLWEKTHVKKRYKINKWKALETLFELFKKN